MKRRKLQSMLNLDSKHSTRNKKTQKAEKDEKLQNADLHKPL